MTDSTQMVHRSWYLPAEVAAEFSAAADRLHHGSYGRISKSEAQAALLRAGLTHETELARHYAAPTEAHTPPRSFVLTDHAGTGVATGAQFADGVLVVREQAGGTTETFADLDQLQGIYAGQNRGSVQVQWSEQDHA